MAFYSVFFWETRRFVVCLPCYSSAFPNICLDCFGRIFRFYNLNLIMVIFTEKCSVAGNKRRNCGWGGITAPQCESKGCCFDASIRGVPWCFHGLFYQMHDNYSFYYYFHCQHHHYCCHLFVHYYC